MNYREYQFWGCFGLFLLMINAKKINSSLQRLWLIYHDIKTLDSIETKKMLFQVDWIPETTFLSYGLMI